MLGKVFTKLTVIEKTNMKSKDGCFIWKCLCECGNIILVPTTDLNRKRIQSCGCLRNKHNKSYTRIYRIWTSMRYRCSNPTHTGYDNYGGRSISVCEEWDSDFNSFYEWSINSGYSDALTLDRIEVDGNYEPSNCRWVTQQKQNENKRNNHFLTINGETLTISQWSKITGLTQKCICSRIRRGWKTEDLILPSKSKK